MRSLTFSQLESFLNDYKAEHPDTYSSTKVVIGDDEELNGMHLAYSVSDISPTDLDYDDLRMYNLVDAESNDSVILIS